MGSKEYEAKYRSAPRKKGILRSNALGTTDWMDQMGGDFLAQGSAQNINYMDSGTVTTCSNMTPATAYTLSSALSMK